MIPVGGHSGLSTGSFFCVRNSRHSCGAGGKCRNSLGEDFLCRLSALEIEMRVPDQIVTDSMREF